MLFDFLKKYSEQFDGVSHNLDEKAASSSYKGSEDSVNTDNHKGADKLVRRHLCFYGSVQGVGFRYTSRHLAESLGLTGWVKNEYDGSVTCEVQGPWAVIQEFIRRLNDQRWIRISDMESSSIDVISDERSFVITY